MWRVSSYAELACRVIYFTHSWQICVDIFVLLAWTMQSIMLWMCLANYPPCMSICQRTCQLCRIRALPDTFACIRVDLFPSFVRFLFSTPVGLLELLLRLWTPPCRKLYHMSWGSWKLAITVLKPWISSIYLVVRRLPKTQFHIVAWNDWRSRFEILAVELHSEELYWSFDRYDLHIYPHVYLPK